METLEKRQLLSDVLSAQAGNNDIAYDVSANLHVAWYDTQNQQLMYQEKTAAGTWLSAVSVLGSSRTGVGSQMSIAVDGTGGVGIAFRDDANTDLLYAYKPAGANTFTPAVNTIHTSSCQYPSLAFNQLNQAVVSYYLTTTDDLLVSTLNGNGTWSRYSLDSTNDVGRWSSLTLIPGTSQLAVAYEDTSGSAVKYRKQDSSGVWESASKTIATGMTAGSAYVSLAFDNAASPKPTVAYFDTAQGHLRISTGSDTEGTAWSLPIDQSRASRWENLIFSPADGNFHLVYQDVALDDVWYLWGSGSNWQSAVLNDNGGDHIAAAMIDLQIAYTHMDQGQSVLKVDYRTGSLANRPTGLTAQVLANNQVQLTWNDNTSTETSFDIDRSSDGGVTWESIGSIGGNGTSTATYIDATAVGGETYGYRVRASRGSAGASAFSDPSAPLTIPTPAAPYTLTVSLTTENAFNITWSRVPGNAGYIVQRKLSADADTAWADVQTLATDTESWVDDSVMAGLRYDYRVRASNDGAWATSAGNLTWPAAPTNFSGQVISQTEIDLSWIASAGTDHTYMIEVSEDGAGFTTLTSGLAPNISSFAADALTAEHGYVFKIHATNASGDSATVETEPLTTPAPALLPATNFQVQTGQGSQMQLTWDNPNAGASYDIEHSYDGGSSWSVVNTTSPLPEGAASWLAMEMAFDTPVTYRLRATADGATASSYTISGSARTAPANPLALDPSFAASGIAAIQSPHVGNFGPSRIVTALPDGKIMLAWGEVAFHGVTKTSDNPPAWSEWYYTNDLLLERLNADGTPDSSFAADGVRRLSLEQMDSTSSVTDAFDPRQTLVLSDGGFLLVGGIDRFDHASNLERTDVALIRLDADGALDTTFGVGGLASHESADNNPAYGAFARADGTIAAAT